MAYVKLDCGMLRSTVWFDKAARDVFITALLMAEPFEATESLPQLQVRSLEETGWAVPPGWYGFVPAAGVGIVDACKIDQETGLAALERLGAPDPESRSREFDGRRLVRVNGGFIALNYDRYRERDYTAAERQRRYRDRKKAKRDAVMPASNALPSRNITEAEVEAEAVEAKTQESVEAVPAPTLPLAPRKAKDVEKQAELDWRVEQVWQAHLRQRKHFFAEESGREPANIPSLTKEIRKSIVEGLKEHDASFLGAEDREEWKKRSSVRAAGIGLFLSPWHNATDERNNYAAGGTRYLEPWRPWKRQRGKPDPIPTFAALYFEEKGGSL